MEPREQRDGFCHLAAGGLVVNAVRECDADDDIGGVEVETRRYPASSVSGVFAPEAVNIASASSVVVSGKT
jgi:hypothetical protein